MNSLKQIAENILSDIMNDVPVANVLLKAKIFATKKGDQELLNWLNQEINGYEENLPSYRKLTSGVKIDIHRGFQMVSNFPYPIEMIKDKAIQERLRIFPIHNPISEVEELCKSDSDSLHMDIPVNIWFYHMGHCISGNIQRAYQHTNISGIKNIIVSVKTLIIDYMLKYGENDNIDFETIIKSNKQEIVMNKTTYNAAIVNTGTGSINATNTINVVGNNNTITPSKKKELIQIINEIKNLIPSDDADFKEIIFEIDSELSQSAPRTNIIKRGLQAMKGLAQGITAGVIANNLPNLIATGLALLA
ncbi:hypothetical protein [Bacteroides acidifaciens]|uniref:AbiTii domain-containing protein n=1 Tax=Bacteroides acidifaciens TaxID=85831 RepID=UPI0025A9377C|nr:hypothetical protein [Bacteroides acidifaciens]